MEQPFTAAEQGEKSRREIADKIDVALETATSHL
jgi:hypothetical protein